jgi:hypothetical protein
MLYPEAACTHSEQARYYLERASAIRARLPTVQDEEAFSELCLLAAHYERLAEFADSSGWLASIQTTQFKRRK